MKRNGQLFAIFILMVVKTYAEDDCYPMQWWMDAVKNCINDPDIAEECLAKCFQEQLGYIDSSGLSLSKMREQVEKNIDDVSLAEASNGIHARCFPTISDIEDSCERSNAFRKCINDDPTMKSIVEKVCKGPYYDYLLPLQ